MYSDYGLALSTYLTPSLTSILQRKAVKINYMSYKLAIYKSYEMKIYKMVFHAIRFDVDT